MDGQNLQNEQNNVQENIATQVPPTVVTTEAQNTTDPLAIVGLILGILSIVMSCCAYWGLIPGIIGLVLAILSKKKAKSGLATAALVCSIIGIVLALLITIIGVALGASAAAMLEEMGYSY